jgi:hypothetical protein
MFFSCSAAVACRPRMRPEAFSMLLRNSASCDGRRVGGLLRRAHGGDQLRIHLLGGDASCARP